jgi:hypothetical protein
MPPRYAAAKALAFALLGDTCALCGSQDRLNIVHKDPREKSFNPITDCNRSEASRRAELAKCRVLCNPCDKVEVTRRRFKHEPFQHGTPSMYSKGCRCEPCRECATAQKRLRRTTARLLGVPAGAKHGTASTYGVYHCRCELCARAQAEKNRQYRLKRKLAGAA